MIKNVWKHTTIEHFVTYMDMATGIHVETNQHNNTTILDLFKKYKSSNLKFGLSLHELHPSNENFDTTLSRRHL